MNLDTLNRADLFVEICDLARAQGVASAEGWRELVDETVESHLSLGELSADQDLVGIKEHLVGMWEEYESESGQESANAIGEDPEAPSV